MIQPAGSTGSGAVTLQVEPLGKIELSEEAAFRFPTGVPGFPEAHRFAFVERGDLRPFTWMVSLDREGLAFVTIDPFQFFPDYRPRLSAEDLEALRLTSRRRALLYAIVTIAPNPMDSTANLRAPIALNTRLHIGRQAIMASQEYSTRERLFPAGGSGQDVEKSQSTDVIQGKGQGRRELIAGSDAEAQPEHHHR